jgi:putative transposase
MAVGRRQPAAGLRPHAERGSQYACHADQQLRAAHGICCRMRAQGEGLENAVAERCFGSLTGERPSLRYYATRQEARAAVVDDIEMVYNSTR